MQLQTVTSVTDIRVLADRRERDRRSKESDRSRARDSQLQDEALEAAKAHGAAVMRWGDIMERQLPQELADELVSQQSACTSVLHRKEKVIEKLEQELRQKEDEYLKVLSAQKEDITALLARMKAQFEEMRDGYEQALVDVESSFLSERSELLSQHKRELDALFDARKAMETQYIEHRLEREEQWANDLYDMQAADLENYARLKAKLEGDVSILEQQLEHMKFTYMLNIEKLEYNYRVLSERDSENKANLASQKARLARLRHALQKIQADYETACVLPPSLPSCSLAPPCPFACYSTAQPSLTPHALCPPSAPLQRRQVPCPQRRTDWGVPTAHQAVPRAHGQVQAL